MQPPKRYISPEEFHSDCFKLAHRIYHQRDWQPEILLALWRGGAIPGIIISELYQYYNQPLQHTIIKCASYTNIGEQNETIHFMGADQILSTFQPGQRILVVDDIFDTGRTADAVRQRLAHADVRFAMVYWKSKASRVNFKPDYTVHECNEWIVFPHELHGLSPNELEQKDPALAQLLHD